MRAAVEQLRLAPVMFELGARPHPPRALYRSYLEQSDVFLGIYFQSYGWVAPDMEISGLEDELLLSTGMPRLVYVKRPAPEMEPRLGDMLARLRDEDSTSYKPFGDAEELRQLVLDDLSLLLTERFTAASRLEPDVPLPTAPGTPTTSFVGRAESLDRAGARARGRYDAAADAGRTRRHGQDPAGARGGGTRHRRPSRRAWPSSTSAPSATPSGCSRQSCAPSLRWRLRTTPPLEALERGLRRLATAAGAGQLRAGDRSSARGGARSCSAAHGSRCSSPAASRCACAARPCVPVPPLELPTGDGHDVDDVGGAAAVRLFLDRARDVVPGFAVGPDNVADVARCCRRLDGLPLAIELAAARLRLFSVDELRARLEQGLDELRGGARDLPERQQALRRTIEWSVGLLDQEERDLLASLSAFSGARLPDVEAVLGSLPDLAGLDVVEGTASLLDKSLVQATSVVSGRPRFVMLETIRAYAAELLAEHPELRRGAAPGTRRALHRRRRSVARQLRSGTSRRGPRGARGRAREPPRRMGVLGGRGRRRQDERPPRAALGLLRRPGGLPRGGRARRRPARRARGAAGQRRTGP